MGGLSNGPIPNLHVSPNPQTGSRKGCLSNCSHTDGEHVFLRHFLALKDITTGWLCYTDPLKNGKKHVTPLLGDLIVGYGSEWVRLVVLWRFISLWSCSRRISWYGWRKVIARTNYLYFQHIDPNVFCFPLFLVQVFDYLIVIDFESTCWENVKNRPQEISAYNKWDSLKFFFYINILLSLRYSLGVCRLWTAFWTLHLENRSLDFCSA